MGEQRFLADVADLRLLAEVVRPTGEPPECRDPRDRIYLHCAVFARVDYLVSADDDLLSMAVIEGIPIVSAADCLAAIR
jgi:predicted nucleic acid-binding protein